MIPLAEIMTQMEQLGIKEGDLVSATDGIGVSIMWGAFCRTFGGVETKTPEPSGAGLHWSYTIGDVTWKSFQRVDVKPKPTGRAIVPAPEDS